MASVLVTGGAGYVGSVCCAELLSRGHRVEVIDNLSTGFREAVPSGSEFHQLDIGDRAAVELLLGRQHFDVVFHFAAKALVAESVSDPGLFFDRNVASAITMLEVIRAAGIRNFVFSSSAAVYGIPREIPIDEDCAKNPVNAYGETKLILERVLEWYAKSYGWTVFSFRYFNAAGATAELGERHEPETHLIPLMLQAAAGERESFTMYGNNYETPDGTCLRDYVHVVDIAQAHIAALGQLNRPGMRAFNIGLGESFSVRQVHQVAEAVTGQKIAVRAGERRPGDPPVLCARPDRIKRELTWKPQHSSLEEIIGSAWRWKQRQLVTARGTSAAS